MALKHPAFAFLPRLITLCSPASYRTSFSSLHLLGIFLPQDLWTHCACCLECPLFILYTPLLLDVLSNLPDSSMSFLVYPSSPVVPTDEFYTNNGWLYSINSTRRWGTREQGLCSGWALHPLTLHRLWNLLITLLAANIQGALRKCWHCSKLLIWINSFNSHS